MGVHGLWDLLAPVGRRVSVETLAGKRLAIDASIWIVQFMKAMRDDKGEMVRDAHLLGFFRRICKLLFLRVKPVFVFDGASPHLKRRTLAARRRQRDAAQAKIRKTAEKLLLARLKEKRLEELASHIEDRKMKNSEKIMKEGTGSSTGLQSGKGVIMGDVAQKPETMDEMLAMSLAAEERGFSSLRDCTMSDCFDDDQDNDDEEILNPVMTENIDPAVLAALPPSMQLDLLVQMREKVMAENRVKYLKIKKAPATFSKLQLQSYLKTVAFRQEINEVQKMAAGDGIDGIKASKIASEANREFIFSSSFKGSKLKLATRGGIGTTVVNTVKSGTAGKFQNSASAGSLTGVKGPLFGMVSRECREEVETCDDARDSSETKDMAFGMTRDLQQNLDFIKECEESKNEGGDAIFQKASHSAPVQGLSEIKGLSRQADNFQARTGNSYQVRPLHGEASSVEMEEILEISFSEHDKEDTDDIFLQLALGNTSNANTYNEGIESGDSDDIWEEGFVHLSRDSPPPDVHGKICSSSTQRNCQDGAGWRETQKASKGTLKEDAEIEEAIQRSLEDFKGQRSSTVIKDNTVHCENEASSRDFAFVGGDDGKVSMTSEKSRAYDDGLSCAKTWDGEPLNANFLKEHQCKSVDALNAVPVTIEEKRDTWITGVLHENNSSVNNIEIDMAEKPIKINGYCFEGDGVSLRMSQTCNSKSLLDTGLISASSKVENMVCGAPFSDTSISSEVSTNIVNTIEKDQILEKQETPIAGNQKFHSSHISLGASARQTSFPEEKKYMVDGFEVSEACLENEISRLHQEQVDLGEVQRKLECHAGSVSHEMFAECQELLQMFGLPYIIAPMEAEAQCAYLEMINLVDGVVTDDSDVFLFGAQNVYKNIFDDRRYVETYFMKDVERDLGLDRERLIRLALLLGSDYTEGVSGIGIVNAIEIIHAFPEEDGLNKFREWVESPDPAVFGKLQTGYCSKEEELKGAAEECEIQSSAVLADELQSGQRLSRKSICVKEDFMRKHRNVSKNWHIPSSFPSELVVNAYRLPQVDGVMESFSWGRPDLYLLRKLCWDRFRWNKQKADELLLPVLKEYDKHETQLQLEAFYTFNERFAKIRSQRIKKAIKGITGASHPNTDVSMNPSSSSNQSKGYQSSTHNENVKEPHNRGRSLKRKY